jgi:hypothetical protein
VSSKSCPSIVQKNLTRDFIYVRVGGVSIHQGPEYHENGVFLWIIDPDGNKVELWEPMKWDAKMYAKPFLELYHPSVP